MILIIRCSFIIIPRKISFHLLFLDKKCTRQLSA